MLRRQVIRKSDSFAGMGHTAIDTPDVETSQVLAELVQLQEERATIVHCRYFAGMPHAARIWPSTYLIEEDGTRRQLLHAFDISLAPAWTFFETSHTYVRFTLVFEGLSKSCRQFHLQEIIPEDGAFYSDTIERNGTDVYEAEVFTEG